MSVQTEINRINENVAASYAAAEELGADLPAEQNSDNLAGTIRTIPKSDSLPSYYDDYLAGKIEMVKALLDEAGNDGVSWVEISDSHTEIAGENMNGGNTGKIAKKVMDECDIPFTMCLADMQSNSPQSTEANAEASAKLFDDIMKPIIGRLYRMLGNHDGAWGNELANYAGIERFTYPYNFPREKTYNRFLQGNRVTKITESGADGTYFYVDDTSAKTRFICLNSSDKPYQVDENGVIVPDCSTMRGFAFRQEQVDWLIATLKTVKEGWSVVAFCHAPLHNSTIESSPYIRNVLKAYKNKTTYSATYDGIYGGSSGGSAVAYTDLADHTSSEFLKNYRYNSSAATPAETGGIVTNFIPCKAGDKVHVKGLTGTIKFIYAWRSNKTTPATADGTTLLSLSTANLNEKTAAYDSSVKIWTIPSNSNIAYIRISTVSNADVDAAAENLIITVNEDIIETETEGEPCWDALSINSDFTQAKGTFIGSFHGHAHNDYYYPASDWGIDMMSICCDGRVYGTTYMNATNFPEYGGRALGTVYEQCLDVVVVNKATKTVKTVRIGAGDQHGNYNSPKEADGYNRSFTY